MADSNFFFLDYPILATKMKSFLCCVVVSMTSPLTQFAPFSLPGIKSHNTDDIIPSILPAPSVATSETIIHKTARKRRVSLTHFNFHSEEQSRTLKSENVKRYMLSDPEHYFEELMKNKDYLQDVCALLKKVWPHRTYLVTGFLTATKSAWKIDGSQISKSAWRIDEIAAEEQIFAVSYSVVRLSYSTLNPIIGQPMQAKAYHIALGGSEIDWDVVEQLEVRSPKLLDLESSTNLKDKKESASDEC